MKKRFLHAAISTLIVTAAAIPTSAQVGIGTQTPAPSAQLDVTSTERGVLVPRMTSEQRSAITAPADGLLVYDTDTKAFWFYKTGPGWTAIDTTPFALPYSATVNYGTPLLSLTNQNDASAASFKVDMPTAASPAVKGEVNSVYGNFGTAGVYGVSSGTGGSGGMFYNSNAANIRPALIAGTNGTGNAITASADETGAGIEAISYHGNAVFGWTPNFGTGSAGRFAVFNTANTSPALFVSTAGTGSGMLITHTGSAGDIAVFQNSASNVARIDKAGTGFFNGGTQNSGADLAESFDVMGGTEAYEPGDVLMISTTKDRTVEKSAGSYSTLVLGVYATKPGVLLTDKDINIEMIERVPMGVIGVIPTKVCTEGGPISRGDLLVTSSLRGVAMKADPEKIKPGQIIGKALQNFDGSGTGKINVFVNVK